MKPSPKTCLNSRSVSLVGKKGESIMTKKQKITLVSVFIAVAAVIAVIAGVLNQKGTQEGMKTFQVEIVSERDDYSETTQEQSDAEFLGEFLRTMEGCEWEDSQYGIYIKGFDGMMEDLDQQYWWCISVDGESAVTGADEIPLEEGGVYNFTLKQGW